MTAFSDYITEQTALGHMGNYVELNAPNGEPVLFYVDLSGTYFGYDGPAFLLMVIGDDGEPRWRYVIPD